MDMNTQIKQKLIIFNIQALKKAANGCSALSNCAHENQFSSKVWKSGELKLRGHFVKPGK